jgi:fatty-acyl-CoA synthase
MANLILVNINPSYRSEELAYTIEKVGLRVLFLSDKFRHSDYLEICRETVPELNSSKVNTHRIESKQFPHLDSIVRFNDCPHTKVNGFVNFTDLFHHEPSPSALPPPPSSHDPANIQFTSGTTGLPKAATLTHYNILNNGYVIGKRCNYT